VAVVVAVALSLSRGVHEEEPFERGAVESTSIPPANMTENVRMTDVSLKPHRCSDGPAGKKARQ
jgi:hypothetical protein